MFGYGDAIDKLDRHQKQVILNKRRCWRPNVESFVVMRLPAKITDKQCIWTLDLYKFELTSLCIPL